MAPTSVKYGCTDPLAVNFDSTATDSDNSCTYIEGCTNVSADNYNSNALIDDGSCQFPSVPTEAIKYGCTDPQATNYDPTATNSNNTCAYNAGCTDGTALNYSANALVDDGSCEFALTAVDAVKYGCTDSQALNYDPTATNSNNTCSYRMGCTNQSATNYDADAFLDDGSCQFPSVPTEEVVYGCCDALALKPPSHQQQIVPIRVHIRKVARAIAPLTGIHKQWLTMARVNFESVLTEEVTYGCCDYRSDKLQTTKQPTAPILALMSKVAPTKMH